MNAGKCGFGLVAVCYLLYHIFFSPHFIGGDSRVELYCTVYPILFGTVVYGIFFPENHCRIFHQKSSVIVITWSLSSEKVISGVVCPKVGK
ncbi:hypothetical protein [Flavobacterium selenitireducens]|uniref:hypothetical protein n=1 Tax=Flavobacterium selenitireducens TaxID=2722704 RepID=UPI00168A5063|nr:hypothetical protein [Flavobacterium selenitireducens]MBD3582431.1 hypothetical protein [Flavobacterium selenitireducens]